VTIVDQTGTGDTDQTLTEPLVLPPQIVTPPVSEPLDPAVETEITDLSEDDSDFDFSEALGEADISFDGEAPAGREPIPVKEEGEASAGKDEATPAKDDGKGANWRDVPLQGLIGNEDAKKFLTEVRVIEGAVYVIDGANVMSLLGMGDSMRVFYKKRKGSTAGLQATTKKPQATDNGLLTEPKTHLVGNSSSVLAKETPLMDKALSNVLEKVIAEPDVAPAPAARVLKSATPIVMQEASDGTHYGTLKNPGKNVFVKSRGGDWKSAKDGMVILPGDEVKTAETESSVEVLIDGGKIGHVEIKEGSLFRIQKALTDVSTGDKTTILDLAIGKILVKVDALKGHSKFEVKTPTALTGVRGTVFEVTVKEKA
ncbi:MAG: FecR domain-containing protein, partial [Candidatus Omnitrophota bacterium]